MRHAKPRRYQIILSR